MQILGRLLNRHSHHAAERVPILASGRTLLGCREGPAIGERWECVDLDESAVSGCFPMDLSEGLLLIEVEERFNLLHRRGCTISDQLCEYARSRSRLWEVLVFSGWARVPPHLAPAPAPADGIPPACPPAGPLRHRWRGCTISSTGLASWNSTVGASARNLAWEPTSAGPCPAPHNFEAVR